MDAEKYTWRCGTPVNLVLPVWMFSVGLDVLSSSLPTDRLHYIAGMLAAYAICGFMKADYWWELFRPEPELDDPDSAGRRKPKKET